MVLFVEDLAVLSNVIPPNSKMEVLIDGEDDSCDDFTIVTFNLPLRYEITSIRVKLNQNAGKCIKFKAC